MAPSMAATAATAAGVVTWQVAQGWVIWGLWGLVVLLGAILAWFIKRLVDRIDQMHHSTTNLASVVATLTQSVGALQVNSERMRVLELDVVRLQAHLPSAKKRGANGRHVTIDDE